MPAYTALAAVHARTDPIAARQELAVARPLETQAQIHNRPADEIRPDRARRTARLPDRPAAQLTRVFLRPSVRPSPPSHAIRRLRTTNCYASGSSSDSIPNSSIGRDSTSFGFTWLGRWSLAAGRTTTRFARTSTTVTYIPGSIA